TTAMRSRSLSSERSGMRVRPLFGAGLLVSAALVVCAGPVGSAAVAQPPRYVSENAPTCPPSIQVAQKASGVAAPGVAADSHPQNPFTTVRFYEGDPAQMAVLAPSQHLTTPTPADVWNFSMSKEGYWMSCVYGGTSMVVSQRLADKVKSCRVEYDPK